ncbi:MAG: NUDIX domain-containing protein, partial [Pseudomonadota bacterium]|nr:NUDIX domain-containing protein [Pseudomonadota bacterium]
MVSMEKKITNAGTIPIRRRGNEFELCVVTSRRCKGRFIFPKGKVIQNEKLKQTTLRETIEEAGVSGELINYPIIHRVKGNWANGVCKTVCFYPII